MPNFVKKYCQIISLYGSGPISAVPANEQRLDEKYRCVQKFKSVYQHLKDWLAYIHTDRRTVC